MLLFGSGFNMLKKFKPSPFKCQSESTFHEMFMLAYASVIIISHFTISEVESKSSTHNALPHSAEVTKRAASENLIIQLALRRLYGARAQSAGPYSIACTVFGPL